MKSEKFTPVVPTEEQKAYEKLVKEEASYLNSGFENLVGSITGKGFNKEDIMRVDANIENKLRNKGYDAYKKLEKIKNSTLEYSENRTDKGTNYVLSGRINGHSVVVNRYRPDGMAYQPKVVPQSKYSGTIDGLELSHREAWSIYDEYRDVAEERTEKIISVKNKPEIEKQNILKEKAEMKAKEEAEAKAKEDAVKTVIKAKNDEAKAILLKDLGF